MIVKDILNARQRAPITARPDTPIPDAMKVLIENKISCLPVLSESDELVGIISDKDIFKLVHKDLSGFQSSVVRDLMSTDLIVGVAEDEVSYIAGVMTNNRVRHIPIIDQGKLIGIVSVGDIVKTQMEDIQIENRYLRQYIGGDYPG